LRVTAKSRSRCEWTRRGGNRVVTFASPREEGGGLWPGGLSGPEALGGVGRKKGKRSPPKGIELKQKKGERDPEREATFKKRKRIQSPKRIKRNKKGRPALSIAFDKPFYRDLENKGKAGCVRQGGKMKHSSADTPPEGAIGRDHKKSILLEKGATPEGSNERKDTIPVSGNGKEEQGHEVRYIGR